MPDSYKMGIIILLTKINVTTQRLYKTSGITTGL